MTSSVQKIFQDALALPEEDRRRVSEALLDSVPHEWAEETEKAWRDEVVHRIEEVHRGEVEPESWADVKKHIHAVLDR